MGFLDNDPLKKKRKKKTRTLVLGAEDGLTPVLVLVVLFGAAVANSNPN